MIDIPWIKIEPWFKPDAMQQYLLASDGIDPDGYLRSVCIGWWRPNCIMGDTWRTSHDDILYKKISHYFPINNIQPPLGDE